MNLYEYKILLVDDEPEEYRPTDRAVRDDHPQEQAANLMRHMIRR